MHNAFASVWVHVSVPFWSALSVHVSVHVWVPFTARQSPAIVLHGFQGFGLAIPAFFVFSFSSSLPPPPCLCVRAWWLVFGVSRFVGRSWLLVALRFRALVAVRCGVRLSSFSFPFRTYNVGPVVPCYELYLKSDLENIISSHIPAHLEVRAGHFGSSFRHTLAPSSWYWCNSHHGG